MKVKVKKIKRTPEINLQLAKSKVKVKAREFYKSIEQILPEADAVSFYYQPKRHYISCYVHNEYEINESLSFNIGGRIWSA